jgi:hypothetical protein
MRNWSLEHQGGSFSSWLFDTVSSFLGIYRTYLGDKVTKMIGTWSVTNGFGAPTNKCLISNSKILGLVTTNATTYQASAPTFSNGFLKYQVASLHYQPNGELNLGSYDLLIDSKAARCLYGFTSAPVSATIQVIDNNGVTETATTSLSEKNGWIKLSAKGFTFSNPIIRVKLTQVKAKKK